MLAKIAIFLAFLASNNVAAVGKKAAPVVGRPCDGLQFADYSLMPELSGIC